MRLDTLHWKAISSVQRVRHHESSAGSARVTLKPDGRLFANLNIRSETHGRNEVIYSAIPPFMYSQAGGILGHQLSGLIGSLQ